MAQSESGFGRLMRNGNGTTKHEKQTLETTVKKSLKSTPPKDPASSVSTKEAKRASTRPAPPQRH